MAKINFYLCSIWNLDVLVWAYLLQHMLVINCVPIYTPKLQRPQPPNLYIQDSWILKTVPFQGKTAVGTRYTETSWKPWKRGWNYSQIAINQFNTRDQYQSY